MADRISSGSDRARGRDRQDRLKAALKANMARRKAQAKARAAQARPDPADADDKKNED